MSLVHILAAVCFGLGLDSEGNVLPANDSAKFGSSVDFDPLS